MSPISQARCQACLSGRVSQIPRSCLPQTLSHYIWLVSVLFLASLVNGGGNGGHVDGAVLLSFGKMLQRGNQVYLGESNFRFPFDVATRH